MSIKISLRGQKVTLSIDHNDDLVVDFQPLVAAPAPTPPPTLAEAESGVFDRAFDFVIKWEGSDYEDVPGDPGGPTKYGIDQRDHPNVDIENLTLAHARQIYYHTYWLGSGSPSYPSPVDMVFFNFAVNTGKGEAARFLQKALGVDADGVVGPITMGALSKAAPEDVAKSMVDHADAFYKALGAERPSMRKFLRGWLNRDDDLRNLIG
jgi:lysozyme family protein